MNGQRGDGIGIEVGPSALRGVRLADDLPGRVAVAAEEHFDSADEGALAEAFVRLAARLGASPDIAARLAWGSPGTTVRSVDVAGRRLVDVEATREAVRVAGWCATTIVDAGVRRWLVAVDWDDDGATRLVEVARRAGLAVRGCDPAPVALARMLSLAPTVVRRADDRASWTMVAADGTALAAVGGADRKRRHPELVGDGLDASEVARLPPAAAGVSGVVAAVADLARRRVAGWRGPGVSLLLTGEAYPPYAADDPRAASRQCVALGAAVAAAGLAGRVRELEPLVAVALDGDGDDRRPWVVERLPDDTVAVARRRSWWRRTVDRLRRR